MLKKEDLKVGNQIINDVYYNDSDQNDWFNVTVGKVLTIINVRYKASNSIIEVELNTGNSFYWPCTYSEDAKIVSNNTVIDSYYSIL